MGSLTGSRYLFFTTSPRTPIRMVPEIKLLMEHFDGKQWNEDNQTKYTELLVASEDFQGDGPKDYPFAARDRVNRGPKALGFVDLKPSVKVTEPGKLFCDSRRKEEIFLRQLLKFQLPSPYHTKSKVEDNIFWVKPYLEIMRLIYKLGSLSFDELKLFGLQLTDYREFDSIIEKVNEFRVAKAKNTGSYKQFYYDNAEGVVLEAFKTDIDNGNTKLRESDDKTLKNFVRTKHSTMRDYADACVRYLRLSGLIHISQRGKSLSIIDDRINDVEFILNNVSRVPIHINDEVKYKEYLFNPLLPELYSDNKVNIISSITSINPTTDVDELEEMDVLTLKNLSLDLLEEKKENTVQEKVRRIKQYEDYEDIMNTFNDIKRNDLLDVPLMLEYNTWRAMTMLDGGDILANLKFDDEGLPMSTAPGNRADIICDYDTFGVAVEVTMQAGMRQYEAEGEPVSRHLAKLKKDIHKPVYCLFIAPKINPACISHFYMLHKTNIEYYGGKSIIVPISIETFEKMVEDSYRVDYVPTPENIEDFFKHSEEVANRSKSEIEWFNEMQDKALKWLTK